MKNTNLKRIDIGFGCSEDFGEMHMESNGNYCGKCQKVVTDFTKFTDSEVLDYFELNIQKKCGRFNQDQLVSINNLIEEKNRLEIHPYLKSGILATTLITSSCSSNKNVVADCSEYDSSYEIVQSISQIKKDKLIVEGTIVDVNDKPLSGVTYKINNTSIDNSHTDIHGRFQFEVDTIRLDEKKFEASYIYHQDIKINLKDIQNQEIKITLKEEMLLLGEIVVERQPFHKRVWNGIANIFR